MTSKTVIPVLSLSSLLFASVEVTVRNICGDKSPRHPFTSLETEMHPTLHSFERNQNHPCPVSPVMTPCGQYRVRR